MLEESLAVDHVPLAKPFGDERLDLFAEQFVAAVAEELLRLRIDEQDRPLAVDHYEGFGGLLDQAAENSLAWLKSRRALFGAGRTLVSLWRLGPFARRSSGDAG